MTELKEKQLRFARMVPLLLDYIHESGYGVTFGDAYRDARVFGEYGTSAGYGAASSNHKLRLAIDLNLHKDGEYLPATEDHRPFGEFWLWLDEDARWGGQSGDGNHYSILYRGRW
jgi:hypothetical protein